MSTGVILGPLVATSDVAASLKRFYSCSGAALPQQIGIPIAFTAINELTFIKDAEVINRRIRRAFKTPLSFHFLQKRLKRVGDPTRYRDIVSLATVFIAVHQNWVGFRRVQDYFLNHAICLDFHLKSKQQFKYLLADA